jgi:hypothetical protein
MSEEDNVGDGIESQTRHTLEVISKNQARASIHFGSDNCLLASDISPEENSPDRMDCDASRLLRSSNVNDSDRIIPVKAKTIIISETFQLIDVKEFYLVMFIVFACEHVQKSSRPTMSIAKSNGCECEPAPLITRVVFVPLSNDLRMVERPSIWREIATLLMEI